MVRVTQEHAKVQMDVNITYELVEEIYKWELCDSEGNGAVVALLCSSSS